ncbi:hypothetical protein EIN_406350 [Entamoeba invadens IP1]|uniref:Uncharacterized protein n=1 Tax=Entamoeba invadens IP1 TaxID=370355 RepID=A0A0A1UAF9_ENTIV|nr:hypothetical protein EIN_406350 [Entamoeba invadens IP1]ELP90171.1 hypothetical protein EIN_406350 [Entamoeba invadens IP1]|eukprot:XP_004256942.1 hypothetical protein EIN_406350 [Entamoeba invadens IP1]
MSQGNTAEHDKEVKICLIGCERSGKTTILNIWKGEGFDSVYSQTDEINSVPVSVILADGRHLTVQVCSTCNEVRSTTEMQCDCAGKQIKNSRTTVDSYISDCLIHVFVASKEDKNNSGFLNGFLNSPFYRKSTPKARYLIVTKAKEEDASNGGLVGVCDTYHLKRYDVDCQTDGNVLMDILKEIVKEYVGEQPAPPQEIKPESTHGKKCSCVLC